MTKEEIIRMALETRLFDDEMEDYTVRLERFAALVAAAEREACAKLCERDDSMRWSGAAAAIRARSHP